MKVSTQPMSAIQNVALVGATGNLGSAILSALQNSSLRLTVLTRKDSSSFKDPNDSNIKIIPIDYESPTSLIEALKGIDAVVSTIAPAATPVQIKIIDAAIEAGVKRFIPAEFGADTFNEKASILPVYSAKVAVRKYLQRKESEGKIEWTAIMGGSFLDWGLGRGLLGFYPKEKKAIIYDGGERPISTTLLSDLGKAVVGVLEKPSETRNRPIYVQSIRISQLEVLEIFESLTEPNWQRVPVNTSDREREGLQKLSEKNLSGMLDLLIRALYGEGYGGDFDGRDSNSLVGVKKLTNVEFVELVKKHL